MEDNERVKKKVSKREAVTECCRDYWLDRFPVIAWMRNYNLDCLLNDAIAGISVGLTAIPQGVAYAVVAGLTPQHGLYSGFMACFVYFILGTVKELTIGPTAIMALMVHQQVQDYNHDFAVLSCFLAGCVILLFGILQLGFVVNIISIPVTVGFTTAAALTIASSQLKSLFGISGKSKEFLPSLISTLQQISKTRFEDLSLGLLTIAFLAVIKKLNEKVSYRYRDLELVKKSTRVFVISFRLISFGRNGIAVLFGSLSAYVFSVHGLCPFRLTGEVGEGFPEIRPPPFSTQVTKNNVTVNLSFDDMAYIMSTSIISIPLISILETISIGKIFAKGNSLNATQEMIALGVSNILGSFVQSMPTAGSFTRSVINSASGVRTPLAGLFAGILVMSALAITATFEYIPKASLAGVILTAMYYMVDYKEFILIWRVNKLDMIPLVVTVVLCLGIGLDLGILIGIIVNFLLILYVNFRPKIEQEELTVLDKEIVVFRLKQTPLYVGAAYVGNSIMKSLRFKNKALVVIEGTRMLKTDYTAIKAFKVLAENLGKHHHEFTFWNWPPEYQKQLSVLNEGGAITFHNTNTIEQLVETKLGISRNRDGVERN